MFERPALASHIWYDQLQDHRLNIVDSIHELQLESLDFNPSVHFWAGDQADRFLYHPHGKISCLVWHDSAGPVIQSSVVIDPEDETALIYTRRMSTNILDAVARQQGMPLDIVVVVMRRGAEYVANLTGFAGKTAHDVVWVSLADVHVTTVQSVLAEVLELLLRQLAGRSDLGRSVRELQGTLPLEVTCGLVRSPRQGTVVTMPSFLPGKPHIDDHISGSSSSTNQSFHQRRNWLTSGNPDPEYPAEYFELTDDMADVSHFQSIANLIGDLKRSIMRGFTPLKCGQPALIGVMPDWQSKAGDDEGDAGVVNVVFTRAVIQQAAIVICEDPERCANAAVIRQVVIVDPSDVEGTVATLSQHTTPAGDIDPVWTTRDLGINVRPKNSSKSSDPVVIWLDVRNRNMEPVELPLSVLAKVFKPTSVASQKKGGHQVCSHDTRLLSKIIQDIPCDVS